MEYWHPLDNLANLLDTEAKEEFKKHKESILQKAKDREEQIKKCHPDGNHWPPNDDCPLCQKVIDKVEKEAKMALGEHANDVKLLEAKFWEIFDSKYLKA